MSPKYLSILLLVVIISIVNALPTKKSNYIEQEKSCRDVCGLCDCDGFYCEDECICECNLESDDNIQCIADMKQECDAHGLEYEILMQEAAKARFLRQVKPEGFDFNDFSKHLVILKQKRASNTTDPVVAAPAPASSGSAPAAKSADPKVAMPAPVATSAFSGLSGLTVDKVLMDLRNYRFPAIGGRRAQPGHHLSLPKLLGAPAAPAFSMPTLPPAGTLPPFPTFAPFKGRK